MTKSEVRAANAHAKSFRAAAIFVDDAGDEKEWEEIVLTRTSTTHDVRATKSRAKSAAARIFYLQIER